MREVETDLYNYVNPFIYSMIAGLERRNALPFPMTNPKAVELFRELCQWQLNTSSLDHKFNVEVVNNEQSAYGNSPTFAPHLTTRPVNSRRKLAICISGGIDSTIAVPWAIKELRYKPEDIVLVSTDYGAPYAQKEEVTLSRVSKYWEPLDPHGRLGWVHLDFNLQYTDEEGHKYDSIPVSKMGKGYIIPNRNMAIAAAAAAYADEVWIVANYRKVDDEPGAAMDKNRKFFWSLSQLLSQVYDFPVKITSPFLHMSKSDGIAWLTKEFGPQYARNILTETTTCYHPTERVCGNCYACFKAAASLFKIGKQFPELNEPLFKARFDKYRGSEQFEEYLLREVKKGRDIPNDFINYMMVNRPTFVTGDTVCVE